MTAQQDTMSQMDAKVRKGLAAARLHANGEPELLAVVDLLEEQWIQDYHRLIRYASTLWGFRWRTKKQTLDNLRDTMRLMRRAVNTNKVGNA